MYSYQPEALPQVVYPDHPDWVNLYNAAWKMAFGNIEYPDTPGWKPQLTCMPGMDTLWQWDSCFMTLFARFSNGTLPGMNNLDNLYRLQRQDGYMSMAYTMSTSQPAYGERVNPPLLAWAEWMYYQATGDDSRFETVLPKLAAFFDWLKANRTRNTGLYWFEDSGSSGMDNSPRSGYLAENLRGSDVCFIDLACQQALSAIHIAKIARHVGQDSPADRFEHEYEQLKVLINRLHWCETKGMYFDLFGRDHPTARCNFLNHKTLAAFWPMVSRVSDMEQVRRLIEHLLNPEEFWTPHPLPTLSKDDPNFDPLGGYWLGGVWAPTNYMVTQGMELYGKHHLARDIAIRHIDAMVDVFNDKNYGTIWECYSPMYPQPGTNGYNVLSRPDFVGWSGLGPIAMLIEHILGFRFDAANNTIRWFIADRKPHGLKNIRFNHKTISCICDGFDEKTGKHKLTVETTGEVTLVVSRMGHSKEESILLKSDTCQIYV